MKYTDEQIKEAARILCEKWYSTEATKRLMLPALTTTVDCCANYHEEIESALRQAVERKSNAN